MDLAVSMQVTACIVMIHESGDGLSPSPTRPTATHMHSHETRQKSAIAHRCEKFAQSF